MKEIKISDIDGFEIGNAEYADEHTGCTVIMCKSGAVTAVDIRGGGPASRETASLNPLAANEAVHAVLLTGGSAFGLSAADGVMQYLEERNIGFKTPYGVVPIVCASAIFDIKMNKDKVRPDQALGLRACENIGNFSHGSVGAGAGATCGKFLGNEFAMKSGIGSFALQIGELKVGAIAVVNSYGAVFHYETGKEIAGPIDKDGNLIDARKAFFEKMNKDFSKEGASPYSMHEETSSSIGSSENGAVSSDHAQDLHQNTTIGVVLTNAEFNKTEMTKIASLAQDGMARSIFPVHTMFDGDSIYAMSYGKVKADLSMVGSLASHVFSKAIEDAVLSCESCLGYKGAKDIMR